MVKAYRVSCELFTVLADVGGPHDRILRTAPVARRFLGQPLANLVVWAGRFGPVEVDELVEGTI